MQGEKCEFQAVAGAGFVVDGTQVVLDDLLLGAEFLGDLAVLPSLDDEADDLEFARREDGEHALGDGVDGGGHGCGDGAFSVADTANAGEQVGGGCLAVQQAVETAHERCVGFCTCLGEEDDACVDCGGCGEQLVCVHAEGLGDDDDAVAGAGDLVQQGGWGVALTHHGHVDISVQDASGTSAKDCLVVCKKDSDHGLGHISLRDATVMRPTWGSRAMP